MKKAVCLLLVFISIVLIQTSCKKPMKPKEYVGYFTGSYVDEIGVEHQHREQLSLLLTEFDEDHICFQNLSLENSSNGYLIRTGNHFEGYLGSSSISDYGEDGYATSGPISVMGEISEEAGVTRFEGEYMSTTYYFTDYFHDFTCRETGTFKLLPK